MPPAPEFLSCCMALRKLPMSQFVFQNVISLRLITLPPLIAATDLYLFPIIFPVGGAWRLDTSLIKRLMQLQAVIHLSVIRLYMYFMSSGSRLRVPLIYNHDWKWAGLVRKETYTVAFQDLRGFPMGSQ